MDGPIEAYHRQQGFNGSGQEHSSVSHFYPASTDHRDFLKDYSQVFDFVEMESSFYNLQAHF
jgi:uncharacterized protein YecE (DUF72 family)